MVDYVQLISHAVASLDPNTREARQALYQRARQTLVDKLRSIDPTLSHTDLEAEQAALESAIQQVERDVVRRTAPPQRQPAQERYEYRDRPPLKDTRNWVRTAAVVLGILLVFAVGAGIYSFWPRSLDDKATKRLFDVRAGRNQIGLRPSAAAGLLPDHSACGNDRGRQIADLSVRRAAQSLRVALQHRRRHRMHRIVRPLPRRT